MKLDIITFGAPMVFAKIKDPLINKLSNQCHHFVHLNDPVPRLPGLQEWVKDIIPSTINEITTTYQQKSWMVERFITTKFLNKMKNIFNSFMIKTSSMMQIFNEYYPCGKYYFIGIDMNQDTSNYQVKIVKDMNLIQQSLSKKYNDMNEMNQIKKYGLFEDHFITNYIDILNKSSDNEVIQLRDFATIHDDISKTDVMDELHKNMNHLLTEIKSISDQNNNNLSISEQIKSISEHTLNKIISQNEAQLLQYKSILDSMEKKDTNLSNTINDALNKCTMILDELKQNKSSLSKNYENIMNHIQWQHDVLQELKLNDSMRDINDKYNEILERIKQQQKEQKEQQQKQMKPDQKQSIFWLYVMNFFTTLAMVKALNYYGHVGHAI